MGTNLGKNKKKILKIIIASTIGIASLSVGGYFVIKHFTDNHQQETNLQPIIDEINALNPNSTLLEINKANDEYNALSVSDKKRVPTKTKDHLVEQTNLYNRDKNQVETLKITADALPVDTSSDIEIKEVEDELTDTISKAGKRGADFTTLIDEIKTKVGTVREEWNTDKRLLEVYLKEAKSLAGDGTVPLSRIEDIYEHFENDIVKVSVRRKNDFSNIVSEARAYFITAEHNYTKDKKTLDKFVEFVGKLNGRDDTREQLEEGYKLMQASDKIKRTDLINQIKDTKETFQSYMDSFTNDENAAKAVIKLISDIYESGDDFVLDANYVNQISNSYSELNERSKGLADEGSIDEWDKNIAGVIDYLNEVISNGNQVNAKLDYHMKFGGFYIDNESKFQILSIKAYYDQLDTITRKVITLENREKFAVCLEIGLENVYNFTELNGSGIAEKGEQLWWDGTNAHDGYGYFAKGTLSDSNKTEILTIDEATTSEIKNKYNKIMFCARVSNESKASEQLLSLEMNDTPIGIATKLNSEKFTLIEVDTDDFVSDSALKFLVSNSNNEEIAMTFVYGEPRA